MKFRPSRLPKGAASVPHATTLSLRAEPPVLRNKVRPKNAMIDLARLACQCDVTVRLHRASCPSLFSQLRHKTAPPHPWFAGSQRSLGKNRMQKARKLVRERATEFAVMVIFAHGLPSLQLTEASDDIIKGGHRIRFGLHMLVLVVGMPRNSHAITIGRIPPQSGVG